MNREKEKLEVVFTFDDRLKTTPYIVRREVVTITYEEIAHFASEQDARDYVKTKEAYEYE